MVASAVFSVGYQAVGFIAGAVWVALLSQVAFEKKWFTGVLFFSLIISFLAFFTFRFHLVENNFRLQLPTYSLAKINGLSGIKTDAQTAAMMNELN